MREWNRRPSGPRNRFSQPDPHLWISVGRVAADAKNYYLTALKCASDQNGSCQISNSFARRIEVIRHLVIYDKDLAFRRLEDELLFLDNAKTLCTMFKTIDANRNGLSCFRGVAFLKWEAFKSCKPNLLFTITSSRSSQDSTISCKNCPSPRVWLSKLPA